MLRVTNSFKKVKIAALGVVSSFFMVSCGSYQTVGYDNDGIYGSNTQNTQRVNTPVNTPVPVASSDSYFSKKLSEYESAASSDDVLTDIDNYSSENYDQSQIAYDNGNYQGWGQDTQQTTQVYANVGWGNNNYYPFWNRGFRNNNRYWGAGPFYNNYYGWNNPFFYGGFYGGGYWGGNFGYGYGNGFYGNNWNNGFYGNRRYANYNRNVRPAVRRNTSARYSGNRNSVRSSSSRAYTPRSSSSSSARTYSPRSSNSNSSARSSKSSSNRNSSARSSSSSSNRSYTPRSSGSSSRGSSTSTRSSRSSSSGSSGTYRRR